MVYHVVCCSLYYSMHLECILTDGRSGIEFAVKRKPDNSTIAGAIGSVSPAPFVLPNSCNVDPGDCWASLSHTGSDLLAL